MRVSFGLVADPHYAEREPSGTRQYRFSLEKMARCVRKLNQRGADLLVELGDFKDEAEDSDPTGTLEYLRRIEGIFREFTGARYHVLGNHDMDCLSKEEFLAEVENTGIPDNRKHYHFDRGGIRFIVLDANYNADGSDYSRGNFDWRIACVPEAQLLWLEQTLSSAQSPSIVLVHQQLDGGGNHQVGNASHVRDILERSGKVLAVFQGHNHAGDYNLISGIHYCTLPGLIEGEQIPGASCVMVNIEDGGGLTISGIHSNSFRSLESEGWSELLKESGAL